MKKFQDFWRISFFLPFGWPHDDIYCLTRDNTALTHLVIALVNIRCGLDENKSVNMPYLRPNSVHFGPIYDQNCSFSFTSHGFFFDKKTDLAPQLLTVGKQKLIRLYFMAMWKNSELSFFILLTFSWDVRHETYDMRHETWHMRHDSPKWELQFRRGC